MKRWAKVAGATSVVFLLLCGTVLISIFRSAASDDSFFGFGKPVEGLDPTKVLRDTTSLRLPAHAKVEHFEYVPGLDDYMVLRFSLPKRDALAFMRQRPFTVWERRTSALANTPTFWDSKPRPPFQTASVELPNVRYINAFVEEPKDGVWTVWISWNET